MDVTLALLVEPETNNNSWMPHCPGLLNLRQATTHGYHTGLLVEPETNNYSWISHWPGSLCLRWTIIHGCHTDKAWRVWWDEQLLMDVTLARLDESERNNYSWMSHCPGDEWSTELFFEVNYFRSTSFIWAFIQKKVILCDVTTH